MICEWKRPTEALLFILEKCKRIVAQGIVMW